MKHYNSLDDKMRSDMFLMKRDDYDSRIISELGISKLINSGREVVLSCTSINRTNGRPGYIDVAGFVEVRDSLNKRKNHTLNLHLSSEILIQQAKDQRMLELGSHIDYTQIGFDYYDMEDLFEL